MKKINSLLDKIEIFLKTDIRYLLSGGFWLTAGQVTASLSSFLLSIAFANLLSKETFGQYKYVISLFGIIGALSLSGLTTSITQSVARGFEGVLVRSFWMSMRWGWLLTITSFGIAIYYYTLGNIPLTVSMMLVGVFSPLLYSALFYKSFLNGKKEFKTLTLYGIYYNIIPVLCMVGVVFFTDNVNAVVFAYLCSNTLISLYFLNHVLKKYKPNNKVDPKSMIFGAHLSFVNVLDTIATYLDKILLFHFQGSIDLAIYSFAVAIPEQIRSLLKIIPSLAIPKLAEKTNDEIQRTVYHKIWKISLITLPIAILYYFAAPFIYTYIFPQYIESIAYSQIFILIILVEGGLPGAVFKAQLAVRESYIMNTVGNLIRIGMLVPFVIFFGIWGIVWARILSRYAIFFISLFLLKKMKKTQISDKIQNTL
ncbi:MAG: oligosaccharide flippase family protein [Patescibacteria group bacterium]